MRGLSSFFPLFFFTIVFLMPTMPAWGMADSITLQSSHEVTFAGKTCIAAEGFMNGNASGGAYSVPIHFLYPKDPADANGTAIVEPFNNTIEQNTFLDTGGAGFFPPVAPGRGYLGDSYLCGRGYTYMDLEWDKNAMQIAEISGQPLGGFVGQNTDGYQIVPDAGRCLKDSECAPQDLPGVNQAIAIGFSTSAFLLRTIFIPGCLGEPVDTEGSFEGIMQGGTGAQGFALSNDPSPYLGIPSFSFCQGTSMPGIKTIVLNEETEPQVLFASLLREDTPNSRVMEIAGASHINKASGGDLTFFGARHQNPIDIGPVWRAMEEHLRQWIRGEDVPPPSRTLSNSTGSHSPLKGSLFFATVFDYERDANGNAVGGIRLPHMPTESNGKKFGAPLAKYNGYEEALAPEDYPQGIVYRRLFVELGGYWIPFSQAKLNALYSNHGAYVSAVAKAAEHAFGEGWILEEDRDAYIQRASKCALGKSKNLSAAELNFCSGL